MKALDLKEGQSLVDRIAAVQMRGKLELLSHQFGELVLAPPGFDASRHSATKVLLSKRAAEAALRVMREEWQAAEDQSRRRCAQLGISLEGMF